MYKAFFVFVLLFSFVTVRAQIMDTTVHSNTKDMYNRKRDSLISKPFVPKIKPDKVYHPDSTHSPRKAVIRSLELPGWGQIYNKHGLWWRLPALYVGLGLLAYNIYSNGKDYGPFLADATWREHGRPPAPIDPTTGMPGVNTYYLSNGTKFVAESGDPLPIYQGVVIENYQDQTIYDYKDNLRRNRDISIFSFVGVWGLQAIDAFVEAKFIHSYTMDNNLSFKISPSFTTAPSYASNFNSTFSPTLKLIVNF